MKNFRDLKVWLKAHELALYVFRISKSFPKEELFGLTSQLRRAVLSIPTNIAEGCGRGSDSDFARFIQIAIGSASETEYLIFFSKELNFLDKKEYVVLNENVIDVKKSLTALIKKLKAES
ncbi:MAG: four helix bundle protein [Bacteroidetes bacterium]|nr:four helix bundle protein [Bacteroidota bacterium]